MTSEPLTIFGFHPYMVLLAVIWVAGLAGTAIMVAYARRKERKRRQ